MLTHSCKIIAIAGGSGAGKTTLAKKISKLIGISKCKIISQDNYYLDLSNKFDYDGGAINFDHPEMLEFTLLASHLKKLKEGVSINIPCYDFSTHSRLEKTNKISPENIFPNKVSLISTISLILYGFLSIKLCSITNS